MIRYESLTLVYDHDETWETDIEEYSANGWEVKSLAYRSYNHLVIILQRPI